VPPNPSLLAALRLEDRERGLVGVHVGRLADDFEDAVVERRKQLGGPMEERALRRAREVETSARELLLEAVERHAVGALRDDDVRVDPRPVEPTLDDTDGRHRLHDVLPVHRRERLEEEPLHDEVLPDVLDAMHDDALTDDAEVVERVPRGELIGLHLDVLDDGRQ